jgi:hypothetical protein
MMLVLKIAGGVFLGILVAALVYEAIAIWEAKQRARLYIEEQKQEVDRAKQRIDRAASRLLKLTPNEALKLCGPPLRTTSHTMDYLGADSHTITLEFLNLAADGWLYQGMKRDRGVYDVEPEAYENYMGADRKYNTADSVAELKELPCLIGP